METQKAAEDSQNKENRNDSPELFRVLKITWISRDYSEYKMTTRTGAFSEERKATEEVQKIVDEAKSQAEAMAGKSFKEFKAISYRSQVVQGTNYLVKVKVGDSSYVHLRIYQSLPQDGSKIELIAIRTGLSDDDSLDYFEADGKN